jgi:hypothetical protein
MPRIHLFEFTDLPWYPQTFRRMQTDYLRHVANLGPGYKTLLPRLVETLQNAGTAQVVDLCSGSGGPWAKLHRQFIEAGYPIRLTLTDGYPNPSSLREWAGNVHPGLEYIADPVDGRCVPPHLKGMRTLFEGFHHFKPEDARSILGDAYMARAAIGVFEVTLKPPFGYFLLLFAPLSTLAGYLLFTPFIRPRTWRRFLWTYLLPLVPLATCWDGIVSLLRVYSPEELQALTQPFQSGDYTWEIGVASTGTPVFEYTYLLGCPLRYNQSSALA